MADFLIQPVIDAELTLQQLHEFNPNSFRAYYTPDTGLEKDTYVVAIVGNQGCGKSTLLNTLLAAFTRRNYFEKAKVGTKTAPGTRCFDGPHFFLTPNGERRLFEFHDGMGFDLTPSDQQSSLLIKRELIDIARGTIKPGFVRYGNNGAFERSSDDSFHGVDLMLIVARYTDDDEVKAALKMKTMMDVNFIPAYLVLTHAGEEKSHKMLRGIPHTCIELGTVSQFTPIGQELTRISVELLKQLVLVMETSERGSERKDWGFSYQQFKERMALNSTSVNLCLVLVFLAIAFAVAFGSKHVLWRQV